MPSNWSPPTEATVGEEIALDAEACNTGNETKPIITLDGTPVGSEWIADTFDGCTDIEAGMHAEGHRRDEYDASDLVTARNNNLVVTEPGTYTLKFDDDNGFVDSVTLTVTEPPKAVFEADCNPPSGTQNSGETFVIPVVVDNVGDARGSVDVTLSVGGTEIGTKSVTVDAGSSETVEFGASATVDGKDTLSVKVGLSNPTTV